MASGIQEYLEGFVYRGRPPGAAAPPAWHVEVGRFVDVEGIGRTMLPTLVLTPEQAEAAGHALPSVLDGINAAALAARDAAVAERDAMTKERDALAAELAAREGGSGPAAPAAAAVSDRQFFQALAADGAITRDEALAAVMTGTLPARIAAAVEALPADRQFAARMLLSGATTFERGHPMVAQLGAALGYDEAALDALWRAAATL